MNETVLVERTLVIIDHAIAEDQVSLLSTSSLHEAFRPVELTNNSIWMRNSPLNPEVGKTVLWTEDDEVTRLIESERVKAYPTETPIDYVLTLARSIAIKHKLLPDDHEHGSEYGGVVASLYRYPPGTRLAWHLDGSYDGAFAMYLTPNWEEDWSGYFAFQDSPARQQLGIGTIVESRHNRLIVFRGGLRHTILSVANDAKAPRVVLAGFFLRREQTEKLLMNEARKLGAESTH